MKLFSREKSKTEPSLSGLHFPLKVAMLCQDCAEIHDMSACPPHDSLKNRCPACASINLLSLAPIFGRETVLHVSETTKYKPILVN